MNNSIKKHGINILIDDIKKHCIYYIKEKNKEKTTKEDRLFMYEISFLCEKIKCNINNID